MSEPLYVATGQSDGKTPFAAPTPQCVPRPRHPVIEERARALGLSPLQARILAGRLDESSNALEALIHPSLTSLVAPSRLKDAQRAAERIADAVASGETIGILTDYDVDGITSHVVILRTLVELFGVPKSSIHSLIGHRINDGYGISRPLVERILALPSRPGLVISADCGSSDEDRIALLKAGGIDVIVTDHHAVPVEGPPSSAYAVVNPSRLDCDYPDATIAGCMVSWLVMSHARGLLVEMGVLPASTPKLSAWLSYVALGTVADCVCLGNSAINRAVVTYGLKLINRLDAACWRTMAEMLGKDSLPFTAETLGFQMGPRINARSRLDDPYAALHFMLAETDAVARSKLDILDRDNQLRKAIEAEMTEDAKRLALPALERDAPVIVVYLPQGHAGVQGIVASRLVQAYGRPCFILTPAAAEGQFSGSGRSIPGVHLRDALEYAHQQVPNAMERFGGHSGAAGLTLHQEWLEAFIQHIEAAVAEQLQGKMLRPIILTDGELSASSLDLHLLDELDALAPYGREFEPPVFHNIFDVVNARLVGNEQTHLMFELALEGRPVRGIWFRAVVAGEAAPVTAGDHVLCAYKPARNRFRGRESLQLLIEYAEIAH